MCEFLNKEGGHGENFREKNCAELIVPVSEDVESLLKGHFATYQQAVQKCWYLKQLLGYSKIKTLSLKKTFAHPAETSAIQARKPKSLSLKFLLF